MQADRIAQLLPEVYRRAAVPGTPLSTLLAVMDDLHAPVEDMLSDFPRFIDPQRAPDTFVPFLAHWVDLGRWLDDGGGFAPGTGRLRQVVAAASELSRTRGTAQGLCCALEWATGVEGFRIEVSPTRAFHVVVTVPRAAEQQRELIARIVAQEKPAHVTAQIVIDDGAAPVAPDPAPTAAEVPTLPDTQEGPGAPPPTFSEPPAAADAAGPPVDGEGAPT